MTSYSFWNNKGGVGKSFLCFIASSEYAHRNPDSDIYVLDLCPQANVSETILGGQGNGSKALAELTAKSPRATVAGYLEARMSSPFQMLDDVEPYVSHPWKYNKDIPKNLYLIAGDNLVEILGEAIRQTSQLSVPFDAWKQVIFWLRDLCTSLDQRSGDRDTLVIIDCNPSFAIYTQLALAASDAVIVPFTADDSSRRGIENVVALIYGIGNDPHMASYAKISFAKRATEEGVQLPKLHAFVSNRVTLYEGKASSAFRAVAKRIKDTMDSIHSKHRTIFSNPQSKPSSNFLEIPDYHSACIVAATTGTPLHKLTPGPKILGQERVQLNKDPLSKYRTALEKFVDVL
jgi:cellulose biosynthesis protein BcsQ